MNAYQFVESHDTMKTDPSAMPTYALLWGQRMIESTIKGLPYGSLERDRAFDRLTLIARVLEARRA